MPYCIPGKLHGKAEDLILCISKHGSASMCDHLFMIIVEKTLPDDRSHNTWFWKSKLVERGLDPKEYLTSDMLK